MHKSCMLSSLSRTPNNATMEPLWKKERSENVDNATAARFLREFLGSHAGRVSTNKEVKKNISKLCDALEKSDRELQHQQRSAR